MTWLPPPPPPPPPTWLAILIADCDTGLCYDHSSYIIINTQVGLTLLTTSFIITYIVVTKYPTIGASTVTAKGVTPMMTPVTNTEAALLLACHACISIMSQIHLCSAVLNCCRPQLERILLSEISWNIGRRSLQQ